MSLFLCNVSVVQRSKGKSFSGALSYISGRKIRDIRSGDVRRNERDDVFSCKLYCPENTPESLRDLQGLSDAVELAEHRKNSQDARSIICALPNELPFEECPRIVDNFVNDNFVKDGLIAVAAIHEGRNKDDPRLNNPHVHILVTMRKVDSNGFCKTKERDHNRKRHLERWRESLEREINRAYERCDMPQRVSSKSYRAQGRTDIEPRKRFGRAEWERMNQNGEHIRLYREYQEKRNREKEQERERLYSFFRMR